MNMMSRKKFFNPTFSFSAILIVMSACGGSGNAPSTTTAPATAVNTCTVAGQVYTTQYGCQTYNPTNCTVANTTNYNGQCVPYTGNTGNIYSNNNNGNCQIAGQVLISHFGCQTYNPNGCGTNQTNYNGACYPITASNTGYNTGTMPNNPYANNPGINNPNSYYNNGGAYVYVGVNGGTQPCVQTLNNGCLPYSNYCPPGQGLLYIRNNYAYCTN